MARDGAVILLQCGLPVAQEGVVILRPCGLPVARERAVILQACGLPVPLLVAGEGEVMWVACGSSWISNLSEIGVYS